MSVFKSEEGKNLIRSYYQNILNMVPYDKKYVQTSYGSTFVVEAGEENKPPLILLHGSCSNNAAWFGDIPLLSTHYHIYALDIPGEPGNSDEHRLSITDNEYSLWLHEVYTALGLEDSILVGNSLGGWLALHYAATYPYQVRALVLIAPSGLIPPEQSFLAQTSTHLDMDTHDTVMGEVQMPKEVHEFMKLVMENFNPIIGELPSLREEQLTALTMPVLYLAGIHDMTMNTKKASNHLSSLVPQTTLILLEGGHVVTGIAERILPFLEVKTGFHTPV